ncbi:MAG TPA: cell division protein ZapB [Syntrophales bacterium]|nr:cell division protein ZapB [Syntrophales bacterium]HON99859.1 cell division protein ZapB [Syntrophales bacterium]HPQ07123.1 cell division protein ZapB [Syntrophales bacterium]HRV43469.1 cell division protein ZapB [Syntrophales bacterium]
MKGPSLFDYMKVGEGVEFGRFDELEGKIRSILQENGVLKRKVGELEGLLEQKERELTEVNEKFRGLNEEREAIRAKVDSLLELLKDIKD